MPQSTIYQDPHRPIHERVDDLLSRMTLEEKIGQMCQVDGREDPEYWVEEKHVGSLLHVIGAVTNKLQEVAANSRLGIPLIFGIDAIHGHAFWPQATVFPTQLSLASSWNPDLLTEIGRVTAKEAALTGMHWTFSPVLGTARDLRWGRIDETFGEDPYLIGQLGTAIIRGYQGDDGSGESNLADPYTILACAKHYAGYPGSVGGRDSYEAELTQRSLRSLYLKPFHDAVDAGCTTFMAGYQAIDGLPCSVNRWLLQDVLKEEWGFDGFTITDWDNVGRLHNEQKVCATLEDAVERSLASGNDMIMTTPAFVDIAPKLVKEGRVDIAAVDDACRRILRLKFTMGLFDANRYTDLAQGEAVIGCEAHHAIALESAYQSIVLLKNKGDLLPLDDGIRRIAVIGPNADNMAAQLGDWTFQGLHESIDAGTSREFVDSLRRDNVVTVLQGIRARAGDDVQVDYVLGCDLIDPDVEAVGEAVELAMAADVAIVVVGDTLTQNGEIRDRADLDLSGAQQRLLEAVHATGTPMVVVLINGKPLTIPWIAENADAVLEAWNPGNQGGTAVAGLLFGDRNPCGKLPISFAFHVGQQPVYYNQLPGWHAPSYIDMPSGPLFAFGYGLSYTSFAYSNLRLHASQLTPGDYLRVDVDVENTGSRSGVEVVQLYVNDVYSTVTTPLKELKAFQRVSAGAGRAKNGDTGRTGETTCIGQRGVGNSGRTWRV